jgi:hypothetical protein
MTARNIPSIRSRFEIAGEALAGCECGPVLFEPLNAHRGAGCPPATDGRPQRPAGTESRGNTVIVAHVPMSRCCVSGVDDRAAVIYLWSSITTMWFRPVVPIVEHRRTREESSWHAGTAGKSPAFSQDCRARGVLDGPMAACRRLDAMPSPWGLTMQGKSRISINFLY